MRKIILICLLIALANVVKAQLVPYPVPQNLGSATTLVNSAGGIRGGIIYRNYADSTAANLDPYLKYYAGAHFFSINDNAEFYRNATATKWIMVIPSGNPSTDTSYWRLGGNFSGSTGNYFGTKDLNGFKMGVNNITYLSMLPTGVQRGSSPSMKYLLLDTAGSGALYYGDGGSGGGGLTTASNGLTAVGSDVQLGGALSTNTSVSLGSSSLEFNNATGTGLGLNVSSLGLSELGDVKDNVGGAKISVDGNNNKAWFKNNSNTANFGIGNNTPNYKLDVLSSDAGVFAANINNSNSTGAGLGVSVNNSLSTRSVLQALGGSVGGTSLFDIRANGNIFMPLIPAGSTTDSALVYNTTTKSVGYKAFPSSGGSTSPAGNYGNIQLNRNGAFSAAGSDSLSLNSAILGLKGSQTISSKLSVGTTTANQAITSYNASTTVGDGVFFGSDATHGLRLGYYNSVWQGIWGGGVTPSTSNYGLIIRNDGTSTQYNSTGNISFNINDVSQMLVQSGSVTVNSLTNGLVKSTSGVLSNATSSDYVSSVTGTPTTGLIVSPTTGAVIARNDTTTVSTKANVNHVADSLATNPNTQIRFGGVTNRDTSSSTFTYSKSLKRLFMDSVTLTRNLFNITGDLGLTDIPTMIQTRRNYGGLPAFTGAMGAGGSTEMNIFNNMDYISHPSDHRYYDSTKNAIWWYMGYTNGMGLQYVPSGNSNQSDIYTAFGKEIFSVDLSLQPSTGTAKRFMSQINSAGLNIVDRGGVRYDNSAFDTKLYVTNAQIFLTGGSGNSRFFSTHPLRISPDGVSSFSDGTAIATWTEAANNTYTIYNNDGNNTNYNYFRYLKNKAGSYNLGAGQIVVQHDINGGVGYYGARATANVVSSFSNIEYYWKTTNAGGSIADRMVLSDAGNLSVGTATNDSTINGVGAHLTGGIRAENVGRSNNSSDSMVVIQTNGTFGKRTIPTGGGGGSGITVGTTTITSGTNTNILYNNSGVVGEYTLVPISKGGTNASSQTTNGVAHYDGSKITSGSAFTFDGTSTAKITGAYASLVLDASSGSVPIYEQKYNGTSYGLWGTANGSSSFITGSNLGDMCFRAATKNILFSTDGGTSAAMYIATNGSVGIGTTTPTTKLHLVGGDMLIDNGGNALINTPGGAMAQYDDGSGKFFYGGGTININGGGVLQLSSYGAGALVTDGSGNVTATSDERLKNIKGYSNTGLDAIMKLRPINYQWNAKSGYETDSTYTGFSAQNVKANIPNGTGVMKNGYLTLQDRAILAATVVAIQELKNKNDKLEADNKKIKKEINRLKRKK